VNNLALLYQEHGRYGKAVLYKRALEARERVLGKEHPGTLLSVNNLAVLYFTQADLPFQLSLLRQRSLSYCERITTL
jgi:hypothetical protein